MLFLFGLFIYYQTKLRWTTVLLQKIFIVQFYHFREEAVLLFVANYFIFLLLFPESPLKTLAKFDKMRNTLKKLFANNYAFNCYS